MHIIAECAQGYYSKSVEESVVYAKTLVRCAARGGADSVKFQLILADELATKDYKYYELFKQLELGFDGWLKVVDEAKSEEIKVIFDIFGEESLKIATQLGVDTIKIHPTDFCNKALLDLICRNEQVKTIIGGTGGVLEKEIEDFIRKVDNEKDIVLLHGFQGYPTDISDNELYKLSKLSKILGNKNNNQVGFADHTSGNLQESIEICCVAKGCGATVIEKHMTLAKELKMEDYESAISGDELNIFVKRIKRLDNLISNSSNKEELNEKEKRYRNNIARHIVSSRELLKGDIINQKDITLKRSSCANPITDMEIVIGKKLKRDYNAFEAILMEDIYE